MLFQLLSLAAASALPGAWVEGVLDDSAFPAEERSTLASIVFPQLCGGAYSASSHACLKEPETGMAANMSVGSTFMDWNLVAVLPPAGPGAVVAVLVFAKTLALTKGRGVYIFM